MARIIVETVHANGEPCRWTLSERIVAENLDSDHYVAQLLERIIWATADAEALELPSAEHVAAPHARPTIRSRRKDTPRPLTLESDRRRPTRPSMSWSPATSLPAR
jgi:hypothetical protein